MKIKDPATGEEREETAEEKKAREADEEKKARALIAVPDDEEDDEDVESLRAKLATVKRHARLWERRSKEKYPSEEINALKAKLKEYEDKGKSDEQKTSEALRAAEERAANAESDAMRARVALRKGLTDAQAKRLVGKTEEELDADADELLKSFKPADDGASGEEGSTRVRRRPTEVVRPGTGRVTAPPQDAKAIVDAVMEKGR